MEKTKRCSCCGQIIMVRRRNIRPEMVRALYQLADLGRPAKVSDLRGLSRGTFADFTKLKYWGLIASVKDTEKWSVTNDGHNFLFAGMRIKKYKWIFNDQVQDDPPGKKNPLIAVSDISREPISTQIVRKNSMPYPVPKKDLFLSDDALGQSDQFKK